MTIAQPPTPETQETKVVGQRVLRAEGRGLVSGRVKYIGGMYLPGMPHVKAKLAPYPNARITRIDTSKAEAHPGVVVVVTHKDVPSNRHGLRVPDQPVLVDECARHLGEPVAAVAAVNEVTTVSSPCGAAPRTPTINGHCPPMPSPIHAQPVPTAARSAPCGERPAH